MRTKVILGVVVGFALGAVVGQLAQPLKAQNSFTAPELVVEDSAGTVVGGFSAVAFRGQNEVAFYNSTDDENFHLQIRPDRILGEMAEVYYTNVDCTGTVYIQSPVGQNGLAGLRGSSYGVGRNAAATDEDCLVIRGTGTGADNSGILQSKFRPSSTPMCSASSPTTNTVQGDASNGFVQPHAPVRPPVDNETSDRSYQLELVRRDHQYFRG